MSKILELLNYNRKRGVDKKEGAEDFSEHITAENFDSSTKEKLASTYIFNPANAAKDVIKKQDREITHKHNPRSSRIRFAQLFPWIISFLAVLLLLVNIAYRGKININVEFLDPKNLSPEKDLISQIERADMAPIATSLITEGQLNNYIIKKLGFYGAATSKSKILQDGLYLFNDGTMGWASAGIDLAKPMNLSDTTLDFFIKGAKGNESLELILRDVENNSYMPQAYNIIFNKNMSTNWQFVSIPFKGFDGTYNPKKINHIGFEFGTGTTSNEQGISIYIKKIKMINNGTIP